MSIKPVGSIDFGTGWERALIEAVRGVRFGSVEVVVHEGRVVQIERREKVRLEPDQRLPDDRRREATPTGRSDRNTGGAGPEMQG
jgi:hypothetical protein